MSDFEKLKEMDIEEIYKKTYIARKNIKALLEKDFSKFDRLKAIGFVNILEREFDLDLSELKDEIKNYFKSQDSSAEKEEVVANIDKKRDDVTRDNGNKKYIFLLILLILIAAAFLFFQKESKENSRKNENIVIEENKTESNKSLNIFNEVNETNISSKEEDNKTIDQESEKISQNIKSQEENITVSKKAAFSSITIIPKRKIWVGIIYLDNFKRKNYLTTSPIELNTSRNQLILTGHGMLKIDLDSNITDYNSASKLRFLYKDGEFKEIDKESFKNYNRGKNW